MTTQSRSEARDERTSELIAGFQTFLNAFGRAPPFNRAGQLESHRETIGRRRVHQTVGSALADNDFLASLQTTLRAWGVGVRASRLADNDRFVAELRRWADRIGELEGVTMESAGTKHRDLTWGLIQEIDIVDNEARVVALTKTLHHLLPDLVPPIDRAYTGVFLGWHIPEFQSRQRDIFNSAWNSMHRVASAVVLDEFVDRAPWNTSTTKVIDNALIGYCMKNGLVKARAQTTRAENENRPTRMRAYTGTPRRTQWTITELEQDLDEFTRVLKAAGLKDQTINTYVGRSETFIRWLAGKYRPRGPNA